MVRRQTRSKTQDDSFKAKGRIAGREVTVVREGTVTRTLDGGFHFASGAAWEWTSMSDDVDRVPVEGYLVPATFRVEGLGFDLTYDVGYVEDGNRPRFGVTRIVAGNAFETSTLKEPAPFSIDVSRITEAALRDLALDASKVHGYAYRPGSVINPDTGDVIDRLSVGDSIEGRTDLYVNGGITYLGATIKGQKVVALEERPEVSLRTRDPNAVRGTLARELTGQRPAGRKRGKPLTDKDLRLIARLYRDGYADPTVKNVPHYVATRLSVETNGRLSNGESWVRKQGVKARQRGFLKEGKRDKTGKAGQK